MRAFKKLMAGMIATAIAATFATSAFAAELSGGKMVLSAGESYTPATTGQTTVLVVPDDNWVSDAVTDLTDADILYIDQWEDAATAQDAITAGLGVKLTEGKLAEGTYYVLFGGNTGEDNAFEIKAYACTISNEPEGPTIAWCDVNRDSSVNTADATKLLRYLSTADAWPDVYTEDEKVRVCDVNRDGSVNTADATKLLRYLSTADAWPTE